jgi:hypothetical protein
MCGLGLHVEKNHKQNVLYGEALCSKIGHCTPLFMTCKDYLFFLHSFQSYVLLHETINCPST